MDCGICAPKRHYLIIQIFSWQNYVFFAFGMKKNSMFAASLFPDFGEQTFGAFGV